jgi:hypothetical protein
MRWVVAWSTEDVRTLRALAKARLTGKVVAKELKHTSGAVARKTMTLRIQSVGNRA